MILTNRKKTVSELLSSNSVWIAIWKVKLFTSLILILVFKRKEVVLTGIKSVPTSWQVPALLVPCKLSRMEEFAASAIRQRRTRPSPIQPLFKWFATPERRPGFSTTSRIAQSLTQLLMPNWLPPLLEFRLEHVSTINQCWMSMFKPAKPCMSFMTSILAATWMLLSLSTFNNYGWSIGQIPSRIAPKTRFGRVFEASEGQDSGDKIKTPQIEKIKNPCRGRLDALVTA